MIASKRKPWAYQLHQVGLLPLSSGVRGLMIPLSLCSLPLLSRTQAMGSTEALQAPAVHRSTGRAGPAFFPWTADIGRVWTGLTLAEVQYLRKDQRTPWSKKVTDELKATQACSPSIFDSQMIYRPLAIKNKLQRMELFAREMKVYSCSFCSIQLPPKQLLELPHGHYIIVNKHGKMTGNRTKKSMTNCSTEMLWFKPDWTQRNPVSSRIKVVTAARSYLILLAAVCIWGSEL